MDNEFRNIELSIQGAINSTTKSKNSLAEQFAQARKAVAEERTRSKDSFAMQAISFENEDQATRYIQYHQSRLINLIDELYDLTTSESNSKSTRNSQLASEAFLFSDQVEDILDFIQREFQPFFNLDAKLPESKKAVFLKRLSTHFNRMLEFLSSHAIDPNLSLILTKTVQSAMNGSGLTYRLTTYIEELVVEILNLNDGNPPKESDAEVRSILLSLNFNSHEYFRYYTGLIHSDFSRLDSDSDKAEKLALHFKIVNQSQQRPGIAYITNSPSIKDLLSSWLWEEIQFLQGRQQPMRASESKEGDFVKNDFKLEFDMSVSQFAFFTRAFVESGVIQNKNISELIRFFSKFVRTKRSGSISQESLRIKYYDVEESTRDAVRNTLHNAIGYINSK